MGSFVAAEGTFPADEAPVIHQTLHIYREGAQPQAALADAAQALAWRRFERRGEGSLRRALENYPAASFQRLYVEQSLEHLQAHHVGWVLGQCLRLLTVEGVLVVRCPDLKALCQLVATNRLTEPLYEMASLPVTALDLLFGHRAQIARGDAGVLRRSGFTEGLLIATLRHHGFRTVRSVTRPSAPHFDLWALASKAERCAEQMAGLIARYLPPCQRHSF